MTPPSILAIDPGSKVAGVALYVPDYIWDVWANRYHLIAYGRVERPTNDLVCQVFGWALNTAPFPLRLFVEDQYIGKMTAKAKRKLTKSAFRWDVLADDFGVGVSTVAPSTWHKGILGSGRISRDRGKAMAVAIVAQNYFISVTEDEADAVCIGRHVVQQLEASMGGYIEIETAGDVERKVWR